MIEYPSESELESKEIELENDLLTGEGSETNEAYETFVTAKSALYENITIAMNGEGESMEEVGQYLKLLIIETSKGYAHTIQTIDDLEDGVAFAGQLMHQSVVELGDFIDKFDAGIAVTVHEVETITEAIELSLSEIEDEDERIDSLEQTFGSVYSEALAELLLSAKDNKRDIRRMRRELLKVHALNLLKDTTKVALGATAAVLISRHINKG